MGRSWCEVSDPYRTQALAHRRFAVCGWCRHQSREEGYRLTCTAKRKRMLDPVYGWVRYDPECRDSNPDGTCALYDPTLVTLLLRRHSR